MAEDFQNKYVVIVATVLGGIVLLVGLLGVFVNIE